MFEVEAGADEKQQIKFVWPNEGFKSHCLDVWFYQMPILTIIAEENSQFMSRYTFNTIFLCTF